MLPERVKKTTAKQVHLFWQVRRLPERPTTHRNRRHKALSPLSVNNMSPKRAAPKSTTQKQLDQLPLLKKPLEQIGKQRRWTWLPRRGRMPRLATTSSPGGCLRPARTRPSSPPGCARGTGGQRRRIRSVASGRGVSTERSVLCTVRDGALEIAFKKCAGDSGADFLGEIRNRL